MVGSLSTTKGWLGAGGKYGMGVRHWWKRGELTNEREQT